jgi:HAD superfamily hydrolase (TIGR01490 family)
VVKRATIGRAAGRAGLRAASVDRVEAAFFDLDKTVIARASMVAFGRPLYREGLVSRWLLLRALYGQLVYLYFGAGEDRILRMRDSVVRLTRGWDQARVRAIVRETLEEVIDPIVYDEAIALLREHQAQGRRVYLVSASPDEIVEPLAGYLDVDGFIGTRSRIDENGRYAGEIEFYAYGPHKAEAILDVATREGIDLAASYAYSDSATDIPMLEVVGHPVAVNPDRELARTALARGWEVQTFSNRVRLRDRVNMPGPVPTAMVGGGLATVAAGLITWWWLRREPTPPPPLGRKSAWGRASARPAAGAAGSRLGAAAGRTRRSAPSSPPPRPEQRARRAAAASSWRPSLLRFDRSRGGAKRRPSPAA